MMVVVTVLIGASLSTAPFTEAAWGIVASPLLWMVVVVFLLTSSRTQQALTGRGTRRTPLRRLVNALYWFTTGQLLLAAVFGMDLFPGTWYHVPSEVLIGMGGASCLGESWRLLTARSVPVSE